jgi:hypothetical protein
MPLTTLPAPEIEIGSRLPVYCIMTRIRTQKCDPVHNWSGKLAHDPQSMPSGRGPMVGADFLEKIMLKKNRRGDDPTDHDLV